MFSESVSRQPENEIRSNKQHKCIRKKKKETQESAQREFGAYQSLECLSHGNAQEEKIVPIKKNDRDSGKETKT